MASWKSAPTAGVNRPKAPNPINTNARPMPSNTLWIAIRARALRDRHRVDQTVEPIDRDARRRRLPTMRSRRARPSRRRRRPPPGPARRSDPSPTIITTPSPRSASTDSTFSAGITLRQDAVDAERGADRLGDVGMVAGHHHDALDPGAPERSDHARRVGPDRIVDHQARPRPRRRHPRTRTRSRRASCGGGRRARVAAAAPPPATNAALPQRDPMRPSTTPADARPRTARRPRRGT